MVNKRKKKIIDGMDREILRFIYNNPNNPVNQISKYVNLSPSSVILRLKNLEDFGIVKSKEENNPGSSIKCTWSIDFIIDKRGKMR